MSTAEATALFERLDGSRRAAFQNADLTALERLLDDDLSWVHASGQRDGKASLLSRLGSGGARYLSLSTDGVRVHAASDALVGTGTVRTELQVGDDVHVLRSLFTAVWVRGGDEQWRLVAWQTTTAPAEPDAR